MPNAFVNGNRNLSWVVNAWLVQAEKTRSSQIRIQTEFQMINIFNFLLGFLIFIVVSYSDAIFYGKFINNIFIFKQMHSHLP